MTSSALTGVHQDYVPPGPDRIDVTDEQGRRIGWVDPRTGVRNLLVPDRAAEFDEMVDFWLVAAGLSEAADEAATELGTSELGTSELGTSMGSHRMQVTEVRYPDPEVVRSLLIPLFHLR
jgi:hypothetical protein